MKRTLEDKSGLASRHRTTRLQIPHTSGVIVAHGTSFCFSCYLQATDSITTEKGLLCSRRAVLYIGTFLLMSLLHVFEQIKVE